jgi:malate dehydrogenase (oxaloacetate-decarboxylating)(NADP+)
MKIPVFHDDQHGTAIISGAGLLNALEIGARRSGRAGGLQRRRRRRHFLRGALRRLGVRRENIVMCDTKGVIYEGRTEPA